ncbi:hypothetical protein ElyMa_000334300 [Elysia marginata]|uniref:Neuropeptide-like 1 n=1 Tax=Elysia marginata TaxID=1093978 RepID=A0AAV4FCS3_9GAST|nr:hypothetical protein ElyMa_000334300 [Elysia marginata]
MKKLAAPVQMFSHHLLCYLVLLLAPFSACAPLELGNIFEEPQTSTSRLEAFRLFGNPNEGAVFRDDIGQLEFQNPSGPQGSFLFPKTAGDDVGITAGIGAKESQSLLPQRNLRSKSLVDRMPMSFGKKSSNVPNLPTSMVNKAGPCQTHDHIGRCQDLMQYEVPPELAGSLYGMGNNGQSWFPRTARGRLERMPLTYGKRVVKVPMTRPMGIQDTFSVTARHMLDRMPNYYGKRKRSLSVKPIGKLIHEIGMEDGLAGGEESKARDNNALFSMKDSSPVSEKVKEDQERPDDVKERKRWSRMDRMPLTYGKRLGYSSNTGQPIGPPYPASGFPRLYHPANSKESYAKVSRRLLHLAHPSTPSNVDNPDDQEVHEHLESLFPSLIGKTRFESSPNRVMRGNAAHKTYKEIQNASTIYGLKRIRTTALKRGKAGIAYIDIPYLMHQLREQKSKMEPEEYNQFKAQAQSILKRYLLVDAPLTRSSRSRLGRMPLTYGKRSEVGSAYARNRRFGLGSQVGHREPIIIAGLNRRSRIDRMPLSYGKRSDSFNLLTPLFTPHDRFENQGFYSKNSLESQDRQSGASRRSWAGVSDTSASGGEPGLLETDAGLVPPTSSGEDDNGTDDATNNTANDRATSQLSRPGSRDLRWVPVIFMR